MTHTRQTIRHLPIEMLQKHPGNIRNDVGDVTDLARSIVEHGILQPLVLTELSDQPDRFLVLAGHRRLAAARLAKLTSVPCVIRHGLGDDQVEQLAVMLVENCQRRDLNPVERAEAYGALRNHGLSMSEIARRTGSQPSTVSYYLNLLLLDDDSRTAVRDGDLPSTIAIAAVREQRQAGRLRDDQPLRGRPKLKITPPHFGPRHPLAPQVRSSCNHSTRTKVGGVGCGPCWETTIRDDQQRPQPTVVADPPPLPRDDIDEVAVQRRMEGDQTIRLSRAEKVELVHRWVRTGRSLNQCQEVTGLTKLERYIRLSDHDQTRTA